MTPDPNEKRRAYFREYRRRWREANREKYLALNKQQTAKKHATLKRIAELEAEVARLRKAGDVTSRRLHWFCEKWGWKDDDLKTLTPEWEAAKEGKQP